MLSGVAVQGRAGTPCGGSKKTMPTKPEEPAADLTTAATDAAMNDTVMAVVNLCSSGDDPQIPVSDWVGTFQALGVTDASQIICLGKAAVTAITPPEDGEAAAFDATDPNICSELVNGLVGLVSDDDGNIDPEKVDPIINCDQPDLLTEAQNALDNNKNVQTVVGLCSPDKDPQIPAADWAGTFTTLGGIAGATLTENNIICLADAAIAAVSGDNGFDTSSNMVCMDLVNALVAAITSGDLALDDVLNCTPSTN